MARFKPMTDVAQSQTNISLNKAVSTGTKYPFQNLYACAEGDMIYINMEAVAGLAAGMTTLKDIALIIDISGSMRRYYSNGEVQKLCTQVVDTVSSFDDDGVDLLFFANGLVYSECVANANAVANAIRNAQAAAGAFGSTMPTKAFRQFCEQIKRKGRSGTVLFLTDGTMDDGGRELKTFYADYLHREFQTRDNFYCYAIEFGRSASGSLDVLDGMFAPEQGPEDLFDLESADNLDKITDVLTQVCGMSAVGSDVMLKASVNDNFKIDMVNADLIEGGMQTISGPINKVMSFRVRANAPFTMNIEVQGYTPMVLTVTPSQSGDPVIDVR